MTQPLLARARRSRAASAAWSPSTRVSLDLRARRGARGDRHQRRRQVDADQHAVGRARPASARSQLLAARTSPRWLAAAARAAPASAAATSAPRSSRASRVLENCRLAAQARAPAAVGDLGVRRDRCAQRCRRARRAAARAGLADGWPTRLAGTLRARRASASSRSRCAWRPSRACCCSTSRSPAWAPRRPSACWRCWRSLKADARDPAGRARHGRGVPHRRPHHGDGQRRGDRERRRRRAIRANAEVQRGLSRRRITETSACEALLEARAIHTLLRRQPRPARRRPRASAAARSVGLLGPQRHGQDHADPHAARATCARASGASARAGSDVTRRARRTKMRAPGIGYVPEGRGIFPNLSVRENLVMAARAGIDGRRDWTLERVLATFPRLAERLGHGGAAAVGRRAADAVDRPRADDQPATC